MKKTERVISFILLCIISLSNMAAPVSYAAQLETAKLPVAKDQNSNKLVPRPNFSQPDKGSVLGSSTSLLTVGTQQPLDLQEGNAGSAHKRIPIRMQELAKK